MLIRYPQPNQGCYRLSFSLLFFRRYFIVRKSPTGSHNKKGMRLLYHKAMPFSHTFYAHYRIAKIRIFPGFSGFLVGKKYFLYICMVGVFGKVGVRCCGAVSRTNILTIEVRYFYVCMTIFYRRNIVDVSLM